MIPSGVKPAVSFLCTKGMFRRKCAGLWRNFASENMDDMFYEIFREERIFVGIY